MASMPKAMIRIRTRPDGSDMDYNMHSKNEIGETALRVHGGRIDAAALLYPSAPQPWIDLSTGINPVAWPVPQIPLARYQRLPLAREIAQLSEAAACAYGLPANAAIVPVPGSELAIRLLPRMIGAGRVGILTPAYGSHAAAWRDAGAEVHEVAGLPDPKRQEFETLIVVNPNNPDGRAVARADLSVLAMPELPTGVVVLRSFGKFFGLAGLRVGFVVVTESDAPAWHRLLGDWPVSGPACEIATRALRDAAWIAAARARLAADRWLLDGILGRAGLKLLGGTDLFGLFEARDGVDLLDHFARAGILVRGLAAAPRRYRFGLPADEAAWRRLEVACRTLAT